jgi:hypothetical protein
MEIKMEKDLFSMKLINGMVPGPELTSDILSNVQKRLTLLYPGKHELKMATEQEMFVVLLKIHLHKPSGTRKNAMNYAVTAEE